MNSMALWNGRLGADLNYTAFASRGLRPGPRGEVPRIALSMIHEAHVHRRDAADVFSVPSTPRMPPVPRSVHHPAIGTLWASSECRRRAGISGRALPSRASSRLKILVSRRRGSELRRRRHLTQLAATAAIRPDCLASVVSDDPPARAGRSALSARARIGSGLSADEVQQAAGRPDTGGGTFRWLKLVPEQRPI